MAPDNIQRPVQDRLLHAVVMAREVDETDFTTGPPVLVSMIWLASRDRVEVNAYDARKPPTEPPFYSETAETVRGAEELWESLTGGSIAWRKA